ncbi:unnamed protein product [Rotaria sp. Silwood2]|nr:unnamed protein product [Rotaria sp. Silwood2]CAF4196307.1 unnamed protein product [Rotaria sp. Silwood2]
MELSRFRSTYIRQLQFYPVLYTDSCYFNGVECAALTSSPLGRECEILVIHIEFQASVVYLVNTMTNLRAITIYFKYDENENLPLAKAELNECIQNYLPTRCSISNYMHHGNYARLQLWIG